MKSRPLPEDAVSQCFRVRLGHHCVTVAGSSAQEAIAKARQLLSDQMPRLWDVISQLEDARFEVARAS